jgi:hypothetical protein
MKIRAILGLGILTFLGACNSNIDKELSYINSFYAMVSRLSRPMPCLKTPIVLYGPLPYPIRKISVPTPLPIERYKSNWLLTDLYKRPNGQRYI